MALKLTVSVFFVLAVEAAAAVSCSQDISRAPIETLTVNGGVSSCIKKGMSTPSSRTVYDVKKSLLNASSSCYYSTTADLQLMLYRKSKDIGR